MIDIAQLREFIDANPKLITRRESTKYPGLYVIKYTRKVFYDALWNDLLEECRGLVVDADWNVVVRPFQKIYNRFERGVDIPRDEMVIAVRKVNGFMGAITWDRTRDDIIYSTTGSLDSDFAVMVEKHLKCFVPAHHFGFPTTWLFEICDESDPHIIKENLGAYLIGARVISTGKMLSEEILDAVAKAQGYLRPEWKVCRFSDVVQEAKTCKHEGFVAYGKDIALKIKSPYYLVTKFLGRMKEEKFLERIQTPDFRKTIDEEYYPLLDWIEPWKGEFAKLSEQGRITVIRSFLENQ